MSILAKTHAPSGKLRFAAVLVAGLVFVPTAADAGPFRGGIIGGLGGLAIGGIIGGGRGAAAGAVVGGIGGAIIGSNRQRRARTVYRPYTSRRAAPRRPVVVATNPLVSGIQGALAAGGYNPGPIDGRMGPATAQAISAYQQANGLLVTGQPSQALLNHMSAPAAAPANAASQSPATAQ